MSDLAWIGVSVARRREELGLTQGALAQMAGLSRATINALERGTAVDVGVGRLGRVLGVLGQRLQLAPGPGPVTAQADRRALEAAARTASVSYRVALPAQVLADALVSGDLPAQYIPHIASLLDEAPLPLVRGAVEAAARRAHRPPAPLWRHVGKWAMALKSPRPEWKALQPRGARGL